MSNLRLMMSYKAEHDQIVDQAADIQKRALQLEIIKCFKPDKKWNKRKFNKS